MSNLSTRLEREQERKRAKRARESSVECNRRKQSNRDRNQRYRSSESMAERIQRLAAGQQREANRRASESEAQHEQRLAAGQQREANRNSAACAWFLEIALVRASVCVCVCPPPRPLITSGVIWCDIGRVQLVKQVLRLFPAFNYFIRHLPSIKWMGVAI